MFGSSENDISTGKIEWEFQGVSREQLARFKDTMDTIISQGVLNLHDGKAVLSFDYEGTLREISFDFKKWKRTKGITPK